MISLSTGFDLSLSDGTPVRIRPVVPTDHEGIRQGFREMSHTSRYMRFFTVAGEMSETQASYFTEIDQRQHVAWCGVEPDSGRRGYGIARFVRDADNPNRGEFAVAVIDQMQHQGLGTILMAVLCLRAKAVGVTQLYGEVLPNNPVIGVWLPQLGAEMLPSGDPSYRIVRVPIERIFSGVESPAAARFSSLMNQLAPLVESVTEQTNAQALQIREKSANKKATDYPEFTDGSNR